ncbi:MAG TPA: PASTA domain-containing protein, partial [Actinomycetota bacterium]|nr:PASTA domain-containing protein [Actinomycetota bacterium]
MLVVSVALGISSNSISGSRSILQSQLASANGKTGDLQGQVTQLTNQLQLARGDLANAEDQLRIALARQPLPRFIGKDQGEAETMADEVGWHVSITQKESSKPVGTILSQKPESGTIMRYGATFSIVVAKPLPPKMPNLVGKDLKAAKNTASRHDWSFSVKYERTSTAAPGTIIHQTPSPGTYMRGSADFTVTVAK